MNLAVAIAVALPVVKMTDSSSLPLLTPHRRQWIALAVADADALLLLVFPFKGSIIVFCT